MKQIFILGSSSAYGVGASDAGWGDLVKKYVHNKMYGSHGVGEKYEVYNFAKSGATIDFVYENFPEQLEMYSRGKETIVIVNVGGNNAKAEEQPDNYVSTIEEYTEQMDALLILLVEKCEHVIVVNGGFVDESKTNPRQSPLTGGRSYFTNARSAQFNEIRKQLCEKNSVVSVGPDVPYDKWLEKYIFEDGLHPNQSGHELIFELIKDKLDSLL